MPSDPSASPMSDLVFADAAPSAAAPARDAWKVLIVDDEDEVHKVTKLALRHFTYDNRALDFLHAYSGEQAREMIAAHPDTALILLDVVMEHDEAGLHVARHIREQEQNSLVRIILRTGQPGVAPEQHIIVNYEINEYKTKTELTADKLFTTFVASLRNYRDLMTIDAMKQEIEDTQREVVYRMGAIGETRSRETGNHVKRVAEYSKLLALKAGMSAQEAELLKQASPMHDIGKVGIPDAVLNKPGKHTPEEWEVMKTHAMLGYTMLQGSNRPILKAAATVALTHHEKWDGSGYPYGHAGDAIDIYGRITALADVFDALGSDRCYKKAWPLEDILELVKRERGKHFDPKLVDLLLEYLPEFLAIRDALVDVEHA